MSIETIKTEKRNYFNSTKKPTQQRTTNNPVRREGKTTLKSTIHDDEYKGLTYSRPNGKPTKIKTNTQTKHHSCETNDFKTKWKTEICHYWEVNGYCKFGNNCAFAHGTDEIKTRKTSNNYKTKSCKQFFENGYCPYGSRCQFNHKNLNTDTDGKKSIALNSISYLKLMFDFCKGENEVLVNGLIRRPRWFTFEDIAHVEDDERQKNQKEFYEELLTMKKASKLSDESVETGDPKLENDDRKRSRFMSF